MAYCKESNFFVGESHEQNYNRFLKEAGIEDGNNKTIDSVLYLLSSIEVVVTNIEEVFELRGGYINIPSDKFINSLSTGQRHIVAFALNLFNGFKMEGVDLSPYSLAWLDNDYKKVYLNAVEIRYDVK